MAIGALLFVDLFLSWHHVSVSVAGNLVDVESDSSAWAGWGAVAGVLVIVLIAWEAWRLAGAAIAERASATLVAFVLAVLTAAFTTIEFAAGSVDVNSGGVVLVGVHGREWPAFAGLVLAILLVVAAAAQLERPAESHRRRVRLGVR
jgi:hypothetical protein